MHSTQYYPRLAQLLTHHASELVAGDTVIVEAIDFDDDFLAYLVDYLLLHKIRPIVNIKKQSVMTALAARSSVEDFQRMAEAELSQMKQAKAFIGLRHVHDEAAMTKVSASQRALLLKHFLQPVHYEYRNRNLRWLYLRWPSVLMARHAEMGLADFTDYYFESMLIDYDKMGRAMDHLADFLSNTEQIRITHPNGTDLSFQIKDMPSYSSIGKHNLPDGELFLAPLRESMEGDIHFNIDSVYYGHLFQEVKLSFKAGQVISATSKDNTPALNDILDTDEGARYCGEFAFGLHPGISNPIRDILFDEKMHGSIHLALGNAYPVSDNGNRSAIHWDLILNQCKNYGGGEVWADGVLMRKNGIFVAESLLALNQENILT